MNRLTRVVLGVCGFLIFASDGRAPTDTANFDVTATVVNVCTIVATDLDFGTYTYSDPHLDQTSTITATCTTGASYDIGLDAGGQTVTTRRMEDGGNNLNYSLFRDASRTQNWGNTVGTDTYYEASSAGVDAVTVYGRVPSGQNVPAGTYSDTIIATITY